MLHSIHFKTHEWPCPGRRGDNRNFGRIRKNVRAGIRPFDGNSATCTFYHAPHQRIGLHCAAIDPAGCYDGISVEIAIDIPWRQKQRLLGDAISLSLADRRASSQIPPSEVRRMREPRRIRITDQTALVLSVQQPHRRSANRVIIVHMRIAAWTATVIAVAE